MLPPKRDSQGAFVLIPAGSTIKIPYWMKKKLWEARKNEVDHEEVDDKSESDFGGMISPLSVDFDPGIKASWSHVSVNCPSTASTEESFGEGGAEGNVEEEKDGGAQDEDLKAKLWDVDYPTFGLDEIDSCEEEDDIAENYDDVQTETTCEFGRLQKHEGILKTPLDDVLFVMDSWDAEHNMQEVETAFTAVKMELQKYETAYKFQCSTPRLPKLNVFALGKSRKERLQYLRNVIRVLRYQMRILETKRARVKNVMVKIKEEECEKRTKDREVEFEVLRALDAKKEQIIRELKVARANKETVHRNKLISNVIRPIPVYKLLANYTFVTERGRDAAVHLIKPSLSQEVAIINDKDKNLAIQCGHLRREIQRHEQEKKLLKLGYGEKCRTGVYIPEEFNTYTDKKKFINAKIQNYKDEKDSLKKEREGLQEEKRNLLELKASRKFGRMGKSEPRHEKKFRMPPFNEMTFKQKVLSRQMIGTRARSAKF